MRQLLLMAEMSALGASVIQKTLFGTLRRHMPKFGWCTTGQHGACTKKTSSTEVTCTCECHEKVVESN